MRLEPFEVAAIRSAARKAFGPDVVVRLFGSRVDDERRGGDVDLHVEATGPVETWRATDECLTRLCARIDEQRVDVIVTRRGDPLKPIERIAYRDGIIL